MATSTVDLIIPTGILLYVSFNVLALFFIFLWQGAGGRISYASILGLVLAVLCFVLGTTQVPIFWIYDNQTDTFTYEFILQQGQGVDLYGLVLIYQSFLIVVASIKLMFSTHLLGQESTE